MKDVFKLRIRSFPRRGLLGFNGKEYTTSLCKQSVEYLEQQARGSLGYERVEFNLISRNSLIVTANLERSRQKYGFKTCPLTNGELVVDFTYVMQYIIGREMEGDFSGKLEDDILTFNLEIL